jgi:hypothetical protein
MTFTYDWNWFLFDAQNVRFFTPLDDLILLIEKQDILHEKPNVVPRIRDIWLLVNLMLLGGFAKFIKLKHRDRLQEGN